MNGPIIKATPQEYATVDEALVAFFRWVKELDSGDTPVLINVRVSNRAWTTLTNAKPKPRLHGKKPG